MALVPKSFLTFHFWSIGITRFTRGWTGKPAKRGKWVMACLELIFIVLFNKHEKDNFNEPAEKTIVDVYSADNRLFTGRLLVPLFCSEGFH